MTTIDHPEYYRKNGFEAIDFIEAHGLNFSLGNAVKYIVRSGHKPGEDSITALSKAIWYLEREKERQSSMSEYKHDTESPAICSNIP